MILLCTKGSGVCMTVAPGQPGFPQSRMAEKHRRSSLWLWNTAAAGHRGIRTEKRRVEMLRKTVGEFHTRRPENLKQSRNKKIDPSHRLFFSFLSAQKKKRPLRCIFYGLTIQRRSAPCSPGGEQLFWIHLSKSVITCQERAKISRATRLSLVTRAMSCYNNIVNLC